MLRESSSWHAFANPVGSKRSALRRYLHPSSAFSNPKNKLAQRQKQGRLLYLQHAINLRRARSIFDRRAITLALATSGFSAVAKIMLISFRTLAREIGLRQAPGNHQARYSQPISGWSGSAVWSPAMVSSFEQTTKLGPCYSSKSTHETGLPEFGNPKSCRIARNEDSC
jgi:hypothetical protein